MAQKGQKVVEARSLSELNYLAANPPQYPINPTEEKHEPFTLYISRVPGTRDVILSPFKPLLKNVTCEDIANSLYYIHLDLPSDEELAALPLPQAQSGEGSAPRTSVERSPPSPVRRKPLPPNAHVSVPAPQAQSRTPEPTPVPLAAPPLKQEGSHDWDDPDQPTNRPALPLRPHSHEHAPPSPHHHTQPPTHYQPQRQGPTHGTHLHPLAPPPYQDRQHQQEQGQGQGQAQAQGSSPISRKPLGPRPLDMPPQVPGKDVPNRPRSLGNAEGLMAQRGGHETYAAPEGYKWDNPPVTPFLNNDVFHRPQHQGQQSPAPPPSANSLSLHHQYHHQQHQQHQPLRSPLRSPAGPSPAAYTATPPRSPSLTKRSREVVPFTLTIIRRDPSSGAQWNVGKVSSFQSATAAPVPNSESEISNLLTPGSALRPLPPLSPRVAGGAIPAINIRIETSGYAKFRTGFPTRSSIDGRRRAGSSASSLPQQIAAAAAAAANRNSGGSVRGSNELLVPFNSGCSVRGSNELLVPFDAGGSGGGRGTGGTGDEFFARQMVMTYYKSWTSGLRDALRGGRGRSHSSAAATSTTTTTTTAPNNNVPFASLDVPLPLPPRAPFHDEPHHTRSGSAGSGSSAETVTGGGGPKFPPPNSHSGQTLLTTPGPGLEPRGYVFASPWDGLCQFRTSATGRSVRCAHSLGESSTAEVSELRFNLPSSELFGGVGGGKRANGHKRGHVYTRSTSSIEGDYDWEGGDDHQDGGESSSPFGSPRLGLGRERAGGGNRGKRAKLGKLIVCDEGVKMLDLVVAANMGLWWGAWERSF